MNEKTMRIVSLAGLVDPFIFGLAIFLLRKSNIRHSLGFSSQWYLLLIPAFMIFFAATRFREKFLLFQKKRGLIVSAETFFRNIFTATLIAFGTIDSLGVCGLLVFILTGNIVLPAFLLILSFAGKLINFPTHEYIDNKKRELNVVA